jgi:hypothetical protein
MEKSSAVAKRPVPSSQLATEDAWELARRLARVLDSLVELEHDEFRLAGALARSLADELETIVRRRSQFPPPTRDPS